MESIYTLIFIFGILGTFLFVIIAEGFTNIKIQKIADYVVAFWLIVLLIFIAIFFYNKLTTI